jgi:uroporphyrin-III C-methyltransferase/precorrin-2 dehydrogenase/sirohydrochlorin ferrochelatase
MAGMSHADPRLAAATSDPTPRAPLSLDDAVKWRRDVRRFTTRPLPDALLADLLTLADHAPSVGNSQPWRLVRVDSPTVRAAVREAHDRANATAADGYDGARRAAYLGLKLAGFDAAPVHLAVFCDGATAQGDGLGAATMPETLRYSCVSMITILWLAARSRGVGLGWVSILDPAEVTSVLAVPPTWQLIGYLLLGWPAEAHLDPELERYGWQPRTPLATRTVVR